MLVNVRTNSRARVARRPRVPEASWRSWIRTHDWDVDAWRGKSACRDSDPDIFFPIGSTGPALEQIETARRICTACDVNEECLEFALATNQEAGVWGGTTEEERRKLRKAWLAKQRRAAS